MWSVFFVFLSSLDRSWSFVEGDLPSHAEKGSQEMLSVFNGAFCAKVSTVGEALLYRVSDGVEAVRSVVGADGELVDCSVVVNQTQVRKFARECRLGPRERRGGRRVDARFTHMDEAKQMCREFRERSARSGRVERKGNDDAALHDQVPQRSKRGLTYPGTLWCGAGNMADHYDQLGTFAETDSCCRVHDHCPHVIHAFSSNYGYTNFKWHSICHCDCDNTLKACLRKVNDTSSRVIGQAFFNVIGVPCFDFVYEERCAERHWYGMCKRYEKLPVVVMKEAVPYDFGGIDVIDEQPLSPPEKTDSKKKEGDVPETTTQSTMSGPEEPSLRNVVTAAEDFIKVLATVSTSQSSTADSDKGEMQSSEKKRKSTGKKKKKKTAKKRTGKGKGGKRKQKAEADVKTEEGTVVSTAGSRADDVNVLSNFISESRKHEQSSRNTNRASDSGYGPRGKDEPSNEVMKDEPAMEVETVSVKSPATVQKKPEAAEEITPSMSITRTKAQQRAKTRGLRAGGRKRSKTVSFSSSEEFAMGTVDISVPTIVPPTPAAQPQQQSVGRDGEKPVASTARVSAVRPEVKRNRSKERGDRQGRNKRRKDGPASPVVATPDENPSVGRLRAIPLTASPTVSSVTTGQNVSPRLDIYTGKRTVQETSLNPSFSGLRSTMRKTVLPPSSDNPLFRSSSENVFTVRPTPETGDALIRPATAAVVSRPAKETDTRSEGETLTSITVASSSVPKRLRQTIGRQSKPGMKDGLRNGVSLRKQAEQTPTTLVTKPSKTATTDELNPQGYAKAAVTASTASAMSPIQLSIERVNAQFSRKKRRKAALSVRQP